MMVVGYKGIRKDGQAVYGNGKKKLKAGVWLEEKRADVAKSGYHFSDNPLVALGYYGDPEKDTWYLVLADGDIDEDDSGRMTCTKIKLHKELTLAEMVFSAMDFMVEHPENEDQTYGANVFTECSWQDRPYAIIRAKEPMARGKIGQLIGMLEEETDSTDIRSATLFTIDGERYKPDTWYTLRKGEVIELNERKTSGNDSVDGEADEEQE